MLFVGEFCTAINRAAKQNPTQYQNSKELAHKKTKSAKTGTRQMDSKVLTLCNYY